MSKSPTIRLVHEHSALPARLLLLLMLGLLTLHAPSVGAATGIGAPATPGPARQVAGSSQIAFTSDRDGHQQIYVMNPDGSGQANLLPDTANDTHADWSPDGTRIAFDSTRSGTDQLWRMNADGTNPVQITAPPNTSLEPSWEPDGQHLFFSSDLLGGQYDLYRIDDQGNNRIRMTVSSAQEVNPACSHDGTHIAFQSNSSGTDQIWRINFDGTHPTNLTNRPGNSDVEPAWSPDDTKITFASNRDGNYEIYVMNADGSGVTRLTNSPGSDRAPTFSPDGSSIAFQSDRTGIYQIYTMAANGTGLTRVTHDAANDTSPSWHSVAPATPTPTPPAATPTPIPPTFSDVHPSDYFYTPVEYLAARGVISGYGDGTFRPYNQTTRAQMVKIVTLGFAIAVLTPTAGGYTFADVPPSQPFYPFIETAAAHTIASGYACGGPDEPCDLQGRPYFRPNANVTRGQLSKLDVAAAGWALISPAAPGTFEDVPAGSAFYQYVETASCHGVISGYTCGDPGEPCDPANRPYFRQAGNATRGQIAKIVYLSVGAGGTCVP